MYVSSYIPPKCCKSCIYYGSLTYIEYGGEMIEGLKCRLNVFLPWRKQTCKKKEALVGQ